ncbi:MAG: adenosylcobinamide-GDP ribazoletransferase [Cellulosilyticaceae bacterium]
MKIYYHFVLGIQFLTRIPLTQKPVPCEKEDFRGAIRFFCLIGAIVGVTQYGVYALALCGVDPAFAAFLAAIAGLAITGGIHLDGLSDVFDGFGAQAGRERTFEIMKDSRVGAFGVMAIVMDLLFHAIGFAALSSVPTTLVLVPVFAKLSVVLLCRIGKNAKAGLGALWIENIDWKGIVLNVCIAIGLGGLIIGWFKTLILVVIVVGATYYLRKVYTDKLGGITGDCLGATNQLIEWLVILCLAIGV